MASPPSVVVDAACVDVVDEDAGDEKVVVVVVAVEEEEEEEDDDVVVVVVDVDADAAVAGAATTELDNERGNCVRLLLSVRHKNTLPSD